jgi:cytochrome c
MGMMVCAASARADYDLVVKKNCLACHQIDKRKYGPNFKEIAAKYADQKNAADVLAKKIRRGGTGVWGIDVMPAQPQVSAKEAQSIASYVLSLN